MLEEKDAKRLRGVSKIIEIISIIARLLMVIAVSFIVIGMISIIFVMKKFDYQKNTIFFDEHPIATISEDINGVTINYNENNEDKSFYIDITKNFADAVSIITLKNFLDNNSLSKITLYIELACIFAIAVLVVSIRVLRHIEKLFKNFRIGNTPFIEENTLHLKSIAKLLTINVIMSLVVSIILSIIINTDYDFAVSIVSIGEILITICAYYIFKYGCNLQTKSKLKIYSEGTA